MKKEKVYVIGKFEEKERVRNLYQKLREIGCEISYDWTSHIPIKPYSENPELANQYAENEMRGIAKSDIVICLTSKEGTTSKLEVGGAMLLNFTGKKPRRIYLVGEFNTASPWFMSRRVKRFDSEDEVIADLSSNNL